MLTIVNKKTWRTCDFPVWERVKHIVLVHNAHHPSYKIKNLGKIRALCTSNYSILIYRNGKNTDNQLIKQKFYNNPQNRNTFYSPHPDKKNQWRSDPTGYFFLEKPLYKLCHKNKKVNDFPKLIVEENTRKCNLIFFNANLIIQMDYIFMSS